MSESEHHNFPGKGDFLRGVHPAEGKELASHEAIEVLPIPAQIELALQQNVGAPCQSLVKIRQEVSAGEQVAGAEAFISAPIHSPINGVAGKESVTTLPNGRHVRMIPIKAGEEQLSGRDLFDDVLGGSWSYDGISSLDGKEIVQTIRDAGIVGLGGAAFPTSVKVICNKEKPVDILLLNGCECEPYLTADHRVMLEATACSSCRSTGGGSGFWGGDHSDCGGSKQTGCHSGPAESGGRYAGEGV